MLVVSALMSAPFSAFHANIRPSVGSPMSWLDAIGAWWRAPVPTWDRAGLEDLTAALGSVDKVTATYHHPGRGLGLETGRGTLDYLP
jgi:hypothetical protein